MAAEQKERTAKLAEKRQELRHTLPYGTRRMLDELMLWHDYGKQALPNRFK